MARDAFEDWTADKGSPNQGGQARASFVRGPDGKLGFRKELNRPRDRHARLRFVREVASLRILQEREVSGLPRLLSDNADLESSRETDLFLVQERIAGPQLGGWIGSHGPMQLDQALKVTAALAHTLAIVHSEGIVHRDIKPANVMFRDNDPDDPVLVDFGLSFNEDSETDVTFVGQEVGNRFLRLPEHSWGSRSPVSDVTQVVGLLFFMLTGDQPRVLVDDANLAPHQRSGAAEKLTEVASGRQALLLRSLFSDGFSVDSTRRVNSAQALTERITAVVEASTALPQPDGEELARRLREFVGSNSSAHEAQEMTKLDQLISEITAAVGATATESGLQRTQTGHILHAAQREGETRLSLTRAGYDDPVPWVHFVLRWSGPEELTLIANGETVWIGAPGDAKMIATATNAVTAAFLAAVEQ